MSQHDFNITTADANTGVTVRAAINAALQALASCSSGATEPATTYPGQLWYDTTTGLLYTRNSDNSDWLSIRNVGLLPQADVVSHANLVMLSAPEIDIEGEAIVIAGSTTITRGATDPSSAILVARNSSSTNYLSIAESSLIIGPATKDKPLVLNTNSTPPASSSSSGVYVGEIRIDANYIYVCTATNTWKRAALSTW